MPGTESISFHSVEVVANNVKEEKDNGFPVHKLPFFCQLNQINSNFVEVSHVTVM